MALTEVELGVIERWAHARRLRVHYGDLREGDLAQAITYLDRVLEDRAWWRQRWLEARGVQDLP